MVTGMAAAVAAWVRMELNRRHLNYFLVVLITALVASLLAGNALWLSQTPQSAPTAAVLLLVPGVPLINASVDIPRGHISAGAVTGIVMVADSPHLEHNRGLLLTAFDGGIKAMLITLFLSSWIALPGLVWNAFRRGN